MRYWNYLHHLHCSDCCHIHVPLQSSSADTHCNSKTNPLFCILWKICSSSTCHAFYPLGPVDKSVGWNNLVTWSKELWIQYPATAEGNKKLRYSEKARHVELEQSTSVDKIRGFCSKFQRISPEKGQKRREYDNKNEDNSPYNVNSVNVFFLLVQIQNLIYFQYTHKS